MVTGDFQRFTLFKVLKSLFLGKFGGYFFIFFNVQYTLYFVHIVIYYSYYMSTLPDSPGERHLFSKVVRRRVAETEICLTCPGQQQWDNSSCLRWPPTADRNR